VTKTVRMAVLAVALMPALAICAVAEEKPGRYTMNPTEGGVLRLDTVTGVVSFCSGKDGAFTCRDVQDESSAMREKLSKLEARNRELEGEVKRLEELVAPSAGGEKHAERAPLPRLQLPSEEDIDKGMDYLTRMFRKFRDKLKELEEPANKDRKI
jgi:hypothetical protein